MNDLTMRRIAVYLIGMMILGCGIDLNTKTQLGVSPIISVAYSSGTILGVSIGVSTFTFYILIILLELILLKGKLPPVQFLQIGVSFLTSAFIQLFDVILPDLTTGPGRGIGLALAIILTGIGACVTITMRLIPNPADGLVDVISQIIHRDLGLSKNIFDAFCIILSFSIGMIFAGKLIGIGIGTVCSVIFTGRVIALVRPTTEKIYTWTNARDYPQDNK